MTLKDKQEYILNPKALDAETIAKHIAMYPECDCDTALPRRDGVSCPSDYAPDCDICSVGLFWDCEVWYEEYNPEDAVIYAHIRTMFPIPKDDWISLCGCCYKKFKNSVPA